MSAKGIERFLDGEGRLVVWPSKQADKLLVIEYLGTKFEFDVVYTEQQINEVLKRWHTFSDWPLLRRELYEQGHLDRNSSGSEYRRVTVHERPSD